MTIDFKLNIMYSASKICFIVLVVILSGWLSWITKNSFAVQFGGYIEIETSCQAIVLFSKLKIIPDLVGCFGHLRPWEVCFSRKATLQVILLHSRGGESLSPGVLWYLIAMYIRFENLSRGLLRSMIGFTNVDCIRTISAFAGSNVTIPYAEIGASFQQ